MYPLCMVLGDVECRLIVTTRLALSYTIVVFTAGRRRLDGPGERQPIGAIVGVRDLRAGRAAVGGRDRRHPLGES